MLKIKIRLNIFKLYLKYLYTCLNLCIFSSGNGTSLETLFEKDPNIIKLVVTNVSNAGIIGKCQKNNIPFMYFPINKRNYNESYNRLSNILRLYNINLVLLIGYMNIIPSSIYNEFTTLNIHPSLLPKYSGLMNLTVHESNKNNETYSGVHYISK